LAILASVIAVAHGQGAPQIASFQGQRYSLTWLALSADGSRVAAVYTSHIIENGKNVTIPGEVTIWDVPGGTKVGGFKVRGADFTYLEFSGDTGSLPTLSNSPREVTVLGTAGHKAKGRLPRVAHQAHAPGSAQGNERGPAPSNVHPLNSAAVASVNPASEQAGGSPPSRNRRPAKDVDVDSVRRTYEEAVATARVNLIKQFDQSIQAVEQTAAGRPAKAAQEIGRLKAEKAAFEKNGLIPFSRPISRSATRYLESLKNARFKVVMSFGRSPIPADLRELIDHQVLGRWRHQFAGQAPFTITLYSSGTLNDLAGRKRWSYASHMLFLDLDSRQVPGGYATETCFVSSDGLSYTGVHRNGVKFTGRLLGSE
jgi:hypothetical protein